MTAFAIAYHEFAQGEGELVVGKAGVTGIDWKRRPGPASLEEMAKVEPAFPNLAKKIREGAFIVVWKARIRLTAEENSKYYLGHDVGIEEKGGWVLKADGWPEKVSAKEFKELHPIPND
jgi:hypothetical protein